MRLNNDNSPFLKKRFIFSFLSAHKSLFSWYSDLADYGILKSPVEGKKVSFLCMILEYVFDKEYFKN